MKISYNWLKDYIDYLPEPVETAEILTNLGLEVEGIEEFTSVKGGLKGVVTGHVISCVKHPDADRLSLTRVDTGDGTLLPIVCGAPNVAAGQKVAVAKTGTVLYKGNESFKIEKTKIRGQVSEGMICAEDELGLGTDHSGIMVLDDDAVPGTPASEYFNIYADTVFEIGITPNRIDGASHMGAARDLAAFFNKNKKVNLRKPDVEGLKKVCDDLNVQVEIADREGCLRYSGITITGIEVKESPAWLQNRLKAIGLNPINNVVDITNYVLFETGQPLHAFDAKKIKGNKVIIRTLPEGTRFVTLDEKERILSSEDLMICNETEGMCIAGVFGGMESGVNPDTREIFLESACFNPVYIRKTSKRHMLSTDSSFHFERGSDPNITVYALKRAALLIKDLAGGSISSGVIDIYPEPVPDRQIFMTYNEVDRLSGHSIEKPVMKQILASLDIQIVKENDDGLDLRVPPYRVDVFRPADVIEEVLRIYGFNNIPVSEKITASLSFSEKPDKEKILDTVADLLAANGFNEIMSNSLTKAAYYEVNEPDPELVKIINPLSTDLNAMRKTLLFSGLEAIAYNTNRQNPNLKFFESGNIYALTGKSGSSDAMDKYHEEQQLALFITGDTHEPSWLSPVKTSGFFQIKAYTEMVLKRLGYNADELTNSSPEAEYLSQTYTYSLGGIRLALTGKVEDRLIRQFDIRNEVYYTCFFWGNILKTVANHQTSFKPLPRFPEVKRDLSMILEKSVNYGDIKKVALKMGNKLLQKIHLFDFYEGDRIEKGKKSYAISFILRDENKTLTDAEIDKVMDRIARSLEKELGAQIRS